jgi:dethiobiotin synthetase
MGKHTYFITGISTEVGKTVISAVITQALEADYWKPVQAGDLHRTDSDKVADWLSNERSVVHPTTYRLNTPMSPHASADIDGVHIDLEELKRPDTPNHLVIEGAGGLLVPLNEKETIADLMLPGDRVVLVSRHYLGSINHTLLSVEAIKARGLELFGIIFVGKEHPTTESIIAKMSGIRVLGRMGEEPYIDEHVVSEYAEMFRDELN